MTAADVGEDLLDLPGEQGDFPLPKLVVVLPIIRFKQVIQAD